MTGTHDCTYNCWHREDQWMGFAEITNAVLEFVRLHPNWAAFVVFALSSGESLPFVSLVLPFWAVLVGIGTFDRADAERNLKR